MNFYLAKIQMYDDLKPFSVILVGNNYGEAISSLFTSNFIHDDEIKSILSVSCLNEDDGLGVLELTDEIKEDLLNA